MMWSNVCYKSRDSSIVGTISLRMSSLEGNDTKMQEYILQATTDVVYFEEIVNCFLVLWTFNFPNPFHECKQRFA